MENIHKGVVHANRKLLDYPLAYGMSEFKLASTLRISVSEAKQLIKDYFKAFPGIGKLLDYLGRFGVEKGFIQTIFPYYRKRWFPNWKFYIRYIDAHLSQVKFHGGLGEIERASKNQPELIGLLKSEEFGEPYGSETMGIPSRAILGLVV